MLYKECAVDSTQDLLIVWQPHFDFNLVPRPPYETSEKGSGQTRIILL